MKEQFKRFPPGWGHVRVPTSSKRAALAGISMYAACRITGVWGQRLVWAGVTLLGPHIIPSRNTRWEPPIEPDTWRELLLLWRAELGNFDSMVVYERPQAGRGGLAVLPLSDGDPIAFVKLRDDGEPLRIEAQALTSLLSMGPRTFSIPRPLATGRTGRWHHLICTPLPRGVHRVPSSPELDTILEEIEAGLSSIPRPSGIPHHWRPMHGDFTPWNLRQFSEGGLLLIDWEESGWGPPGADRVLYLASEAAVRRRSLTVSPYQEAVRFWSERVASRPIEDRDHRLTRGLIGSLNRMEARS